MRTTLDIDEPVLSELKAVRAKEGKSLGRLVSDLLAAALAAQRHGKAKAPERLCWRSKPMGTRVDLADREALYDAMDGRHQ